MLFDTRRAFLRGAFGATPLLAQVARSTHNAGSDEPRFPGVAYPNYSRVLPDYLRSLATAAYEKRDAALARIQSKGAARERQLWVRKTLIDLIGKLPEKTELNPQVLGSFVRQGYRVEKVIYESRPGLHVSGNLYLPAAGQAPFPGVLFQLGHSDNGKAWVPYQRACQSLARLGFVVLAFDPMGQGERVYYPDAGGTQTRLSGGPDAEHTLPGKQMILAGATCTQVQLWDAIRSLDYLASRPEVDPTRLASTGQSGGATLTMLLAAVDDRLKTAAVFSGNTENFACRNFLPPGSTDDAEQNFVGAGPAGFDRCDLLYAFAPKPLLVSISDKDSFGTYSPNYVASSWDEYQKLDRFYQLMGGQEGLSWADTPLPHGLSYDSRMQMYRWLWRRLDRPGAPPATEPDGAPEPDANLWVSKTGSVVRSFGGVTPFGLTARRAQNLKPGDLSGAVGRLPGFYAGETNARAMSLRKVAAADGLSIEAIDIFSEAVSSEAAVHLPAWLFRPARPNANRPVLLMLHPAGRNHAWKEGEICQELAGKGVTVCAADVRGVGDMSPEFSPGAPQYAHPHQAEEDYAWASLILGRPLVAQRTADIVALAKALRTGLGMQGRSVVIAAAGHLTVPATFAAALDREIAGLYLAGGLSSYRSIVETEEPAHPLANFLPNILAHTDLPEVIAGLTPRRVVIAGAVDARNAPHAEAEARRIYRAALGGQNVDVRPEALWTLRALEEFAA